MLADPPALTIVEPDFARRIDLPGAGPCPRPVEIDRARTGFSQLVSLRVYSFAAGVAIHGEAEEDEVFVVLMRGRAEIGVDQAGTRVGDFSLGTNGGDRAAYLPPRAAYLLVATDDCDIAYARVKPPTSDLRDAAGFAPDGDRLIVRRHAVGMELALITLPAGGSFETGGADRERFVHVRSDDGGAAIVAGERIANWGSATLEPAAPAMLAAEGGKIDALIVSATLHSSVKGATDEQQ